MPEPIVVEIIGDAESLLASFDDIAAGAEGAAESISGFASAGDGLTVLEDILTALQELTSSLEEGFSSLDESLSAISGSADEAASSLEGIESSVGSLDSVSTALDGISEQLDALPGQADAANEALSSSAGEGGSSLLDMGMKAGMAFFGIQAAFQLAKGAMDGLLSGNESMEQLQVAFQNIDHSSSGATAELKKLYTFAAVTPFQFPDIAQAAMSMQAVGVNADQVIPDLTAVGDALSKVGQTTPANLMSVTQIFDKIMTQGQLTSVTMRELGLHMLPAWQILADGAGKSEAQLKAMTKKGLDAKDAMNWLVKGMEDFGKGGMAQQALTFNGLMTTFKDNVESAWRSFTGPLFTMAKGALVDLGNLVSSSKFQDFAKSLGQGLQTAMSGLGKYLAPHLGDIGAIFGPIIGAVPGLLSKLEPLGKTISDIALKITDWIAKSGIVKTVIHDVQVVVGDLVPPFQDLAQALGDTVMQFLNWTEQSGALQDLGTVISDVAGFVGTLVGWVASLIDWFNQGSVPAQILRDVLIGVGIAIAGIKIAGFIQDMIQLGIKTAETATNFAVDLVNGVKDFGQGLSNIVNGDIPALQQATEGAVASEEAIGTTMTESVAPDVATGTAEVRASFAEVAAAAADTATSEELIGTTMKTTVADDVATGAAESEASIAAIGTEAETTEATVSTASETMGGAISGLMGPIGLVIGGLTLVGTAGAGAADAMNKGFASAEQDVIQHAGGMAQYMDTQFQTMNNSASTNGSQMATNIDNYLADMEQKGYLHVSTFSQQAQAALAQINPAWANDLAQMDADTQSYMEQLGNYLNQQAMKMVQSVNHISAGVMKNFANDSYNPNDPSEMDPTAAAKLLNTPSTSTPPPGVKAHASGGINLPPYMSYLAGERGPELITPSGGTNVYTAAQTMALLSGSGSGSGDSSGGGGSLSDDQVITILTQMLGVQQAQQALLSTMVQQQQQQQQAGALGNVNVYGTTNPMAVYQQQNYLQGLAIENAIRGATNGL